MPNYRLIVRTYRDERFVDPEVLMDKGIALDPEPQLGKRSRLLMEVFRADTAYFLRRFADGKPTADFVKRVFSRENQSRFSLWMPPSSVVQLVDPEIFKMTSSGVKPDLTFTVEYIRPGTRGEYETHITHTFGLEPWSSVRIEVTADGKEERLTMTEYLVNE